MGERPRVRLSELMRVVSPGYRCPGPTSDTTKGEGGSSGGPTPSVMDYEGAAVALAATEGALDFPAGAQVPPAPAWPLTGGGAQKIGELPDSVLVVDEPAPTLDLPAVQEKDTGHLWEQYKGIGGGQTTTTLEGTPLTGAAQPQVSLEGVETQRTCPRCNRVLDDDEALCRTCYPFAAGPVVDEAPTANVPSSPGDIVSELHCLYCGALRPATAAPCPACAAPPGVPQARNPDNPYAPEPEVM